MLQFIRNLKDYLGNVNKKEKKNLLQKIKLCLPEKDITSKYKTSHLTLLRF